MLQFGYRPQLRMPQPMLGQQQMMMMQGDAGFDGKMLRKAMARKTVDYNTSAVRYLEDRIWKRDYRDERALQADPLYTQQLTLPQDMLDNPANCVTTKFIRAALNKDPRPVFCVCWTPDGRRLITGASSGEFTLWNGLTFNFETILQAHNSAVRAMIWSRSEQWMLTGDDKGYIKYWQANMNNVKMEQGHAEAIRGLSFAPTDCKFTSCSDDRTVRIFDFVTCKEETVLNGHGSDVKCVDWHPFKSLIVSGSKDSQQPIILWDPRLYGSKKITTLHAHKNTCTDLKWNQFNGNWLVSSSKDHLCKLFDIRNLKEEVQSFRGHKKDACTVAWHPIYEKFFASGGADGSIIFWQIGAEKELDSMGDAHEGMVWDLSWHPLGHMLVSGSNDRSTRFWTRNRPGDTILDKADEISMPKAERVTGIIFKNIELHESDEQKEGLVCLPGLGLEKDMIDSLGENDDSSNELSPSSSSQKLSQQQQQLIMLQQQHQIQQQHNLQLQQQFKKESTIQNLDADDDASKKKAPYSKPIPKEFEKAWKSNKSMNQAPPSLLLMSMPPPPSSTNQSTNLLTNSNSFNSDLKNQDSRHLNSSPMNKSSSQPIRLMDLMATSLEPVTTNIQQQKNFKRKLSQEMNSLSPTNQTEQDTDDRQWQSNTNNNNNNNNNKNRPFYQKGKNNYNYNDENNTNQDDDFDENENGNNFNNNQFNNNNNNNNNSNNFNQNRFNQNRGGNNSNMRRGGFNTQQHNTFNNAKKFSDNNNQDEENWQSEDNDNDGYNEEFNGNNFNNNNNNRNRGGNRNRGSFNNNNNKNWQSYSNNNNTNDDGNDVNNDNYDSNNFDNNNRIKNNRRGGFTQRRGYYNNNNNNNNNNNMVSENNNS